MHPVVAVGSELSNVKRRMVDRGNEAQKVKKEEKHLSDSVAAADGVRCHRTSLRFGCCPVRVSVAVEGTGSLLLLFARLSAGLGGTERRVLLCACLRSWTAVCVGWCSCTRVCRSGQKEAVKPVSFFAFCTHRSCRAKTARPPYRQKSGR